ncbi:MAG: hypothetical protein HPZ91_02510 [Lentisphaeria bacterium]|nr:hypothetical protein [Lentisphaeria bacterium]
MKSLFYLIVLAVTLALPPAGGAAPAAQGRFGAAQGTLLRDRGNSEELPKLEVRNLGKSDIEVTLKAALTDPAGKVRNSRESKLTIPAGSLKTVDPFDGAPSKVRNEILLFTAELSAGQEKTELSGIFGTPRPVPAAAADIFGMNVHLGRFTPAERWKLMQMLKAAGVSTVRTDAGFQIPDDPAAVCKAVEKISEELLGLEAFGMRGMVMLGYFPGPFYESAEKQRLAFDWARKIAEGLKGRADFHYGNETNSGWAGFGAAADMAALNNAFALGTAAADPAALKGSFGIAEGLLAYVDEFTKCGTLDQLDAIAIHPYCGTPEAGVSKMAAARDLIRSRGGSLQLWATEIGFHTDDNGRFNQLTGELTGVAGFTTQLQQQLLPRLFILGKSAGIDRIYWYDFFGKYDPETFWLVDENYNPRPSYRSLAECAKRIKNAIAVDGTERGALIQKHLFRRPDGSVVMACWALKTKAGADFILPESAELYDDLGRKLERPADGKLQLGHGVVYVENLDPKLVPSLLDRRVLLTSFGSKSFHRPLHRFTVRPGGKFEIPYVVFNGTESSVRVTPELLKGTPGWKVELPREFSADSRRNTVRTVAATVPGTAVPGVEYTLKFGGTVDGLRFARPYEVRIKVDGRFPYKAIKEIPSGDYPMWDTMDESKIACGASELTAGYGKVTVDADLSEWKPGEFHPIDQKFQHMLRDAGRPMHEDWNGQVALRWDEKYLYAAFLVEDDELCFPDFLSRDWRDTDNIRLFVSSVSDPAKRTDKISADDLLLIMTPTGLTHTENPMVNIASLGGVLRTGAEQQIEMKSRVWKNGYVMEVKVPFALFHAKPEAGAILGINIMADDIDGNFRQHVAMTCGKSFSYWNSPKALGNLRLKKQ